MVNVHAILVCLNPRESKWELPIELGAAVSSYLVGWKAASPQVEAGIPDVAAEILAKSLVDFSLVTFPRRTGRHLAFAHTRRSEDVRRALMADDYDWSLRAQVIFLTPPEAPPPKLSQEDLRQAGIGKEFFRLIDKGIAGLVLPGVDGDVAGVYLFSESLVGPSLRSLKRACEEEGVQFREVTEDELTDYLAEG
jgi:hypothetical protein